MAKKLSNIEFIEKCKTIYKNKYDYSLIDYVNSREKVILICKNHGEFKVLANNLILKKKGCPKCGNGLSKNKRSSSKLNFTEKSKKIHNKKYDYSLVEYNNNKTNVTIICPKHGIFEQRPDSHLRGSGCNKCGIKEQRCKVRKIPLKLASFNIKFRVLISNSYKRKGFTKNSKTSEILGCTWQEFKQHLENNEYGFKISDSNMDLDHIIPISSAKTEQELIKLNHYTNFQLLPSYYNRWIKSNKKFDVNHFEEWLNEIKV